MSNSPAQPSAAHTPHPEHKESIKETLISIIIAFVLAFVFRGFVIEAFVIPTGSMAPTLMGQHMRFTGERTGRDWPVGPWYYPNLADTQNPAPIQGKPTYPPVFVHDPMTGDRIEQDSVQTRAGDRILVLKYLYALREPERFDVVVFKNPENSSDNYIKRLIGLAGDQLALVDGDVFWRRPEPGEQPPDPVNPLNAAPVWEKTDWRIARKPADAARAVWQCVFDSSYSPITAGGEFTKPFVSPWVGAAGDTALASKDWQISGSRSYKFAGNAKGVLRWNGEATFFTEKDDPMFRKNNWPLSQPWSIDDRYPYDEAQSMPHRPDYPVSDIRLRAGFEPGTSQPLEVAALVRARGHEFRGTIAGGKALVQMRIAPTPDQPDPAWQELGRGEANLPAGAITDVEFWHMDQSVQLWVGGKRVAYGEYNWNPAERIRYATGTDLRKLIDPNEREFRNGLGLALPSSYKRPSVEWQVSAPATMHRVALDRDLHYRPDMRGSLPGWGTHPMTTMTLTPDEFFVCGDNSPQSKDGRLWAEPEAWVQTLLDPKPGVVPRRLMLGKAFFVYFPALAGSNPIPMPDFGRLRFVR